jgi:hypothetical protein
MTRTTILKGTRKVLEKAGFEFQWGSSAYECNVRYRGEGIITMRTQRVYAIPRQDILEWYDGEIYAGREF